MGDLILYGLLAVGVVAWIVWSTKISRNERERVAALNRRIGWGYGYGAGYADASRGREYDLTPPHDGYVRPPCTARTAQGAE